MLIEPDVGVSNPAIIRSRVVFPQPEGPSAKGNIVAEFFFGVFGKFRGHLIGELARQPTSDAKNGEFDLFAF